MVLVLVLEKKLRLGEVVRGSHLSVATTVGIAEEGEEIKLLCPPTHQVVLICQNS